jgi:plastocyanin
MKKLMVLIAAVGALGAAGVANAATTNVAITAKGFKPAEVAIRPGDTVTWKNTDRSPRQVVSNTGLFKSPVLKPGQSYSFVFGEESSYSYHGAFNPRLTGTVHVRSTRPTIGITRIRAIYGNPIRVFGSIPSERASGGELLRPLPEGRGRSCETAAR